MTSIIKNPGSNSAMFNGTLKDLCRPGRRREPRVPWLRTNGLNTNGVTAKVLCLTDSQQKVNMYFWEITNDAASCGCLWSAKPTAVIQAGSRDSLPDAYIYIYIYIYMYLSLSLHVYICIYIYIYMMYTYVCMYIYIYT